MDEQIKQTIWAIANTYSKRAVIQALIDFDAMWLKKDGTTPKQAKQYRANIKAYRAALKVVK